MRNVMFGCLTMLLSGLFLGCVHQRGLNWEVKSLQVGPGAPAKPPTCAVRQEFLLPKEAQDRYRLVGVVCHVGGWFVSDQPVTTSSGSWPDMDAQTVRPSAAASPPVREPATLLDDVREDTCRLGGEIIVRHGFCSLPLAPGPRAPRSASGVEFGVYETQSPAPIASTATH